MEPKSLQFHVHYRLVKTNHETVRKRLKSLFGDAEGAGRPQTAAALDGARGPQTTAALEGPAAHPVTPYGACVALAALAGAVLLDVAGKRYARVLPGGPRTAALFMLCGFVGARLLYCLLRLPYYMEVGFVHMLMTREGGFLLYGALSGVAAAAWLLTRGDRGSFAEAMDELTLPGLAVIALCRLAEGFAGEGLGDWVEEGFFCRLPFAAPNVYGEYQWALFIPEALAAVCIFAACRNEPTGEGRRAQRALTLYAACQIVLESLRMDGVLKIDHRRQFPKYSGRRFTTWFRRKAQAAQAAFPRQVSYFHGCYVNYNYPQLGKDFVHVMNARG